MVFLKSFVVVIGLTRINVLESIYLNCLPIGDILIVSVSRIKIWWWWKMGIYLVIFIFFFILVGLVYRWLRVYKCWSLILEFIGKKMWTAYVFRRIVDKFEVPMHWLNFHLLDRCLDGCLFCVHNVFIYIVLDYKKYTWIGLVWLGRQAFFKYLEYCPVMFNMDIVAGT